MPERGGRAAARRARCRRVQGLQRRGEAPRTAAARGGRATAKGQCEGRCSNDGQSRPEIRVAGRLSQHRDPPPRCNPGRRDGPPPAVQRAVPQQRCVVGRPRAARASPRRGAGLFGRAAGPPPSPPPSRTRACSRPPPSRAAPPRAHPRLQPRSLGSWASRPRWCLRVSSLGRAVRRNAGPPPNLRWRRAAAHLRRISHPSTSMRSFIRTRSPAPPRLLPNLPLPPRPRRRVWHRQGWRRHRVHGHHAPDAGHEEHRARHHGGYSGHLRPHRCR